MKRSTFLLITSIYGAILATCMVFMPTMTLQSYGVNPPDINHKDLIQYLGEANFGLALMGFLFRNSTETQSVRIFLLGNTVVIFSAVILGVFQVVSRPADSVSNFFYFDTAFRLALGLATLYFWNKEK